MKILFPGGVVKEIKPTTCNPTTENGKIKCCLVLDPILTMAEAKIVKNAASDEITIEQTINNDVIDENQMFVDGLDPLIP